MPTYKYRARTVDGQLQAGLVDAPSMQDASDALSDRGYDVLILEPLSRTRQKRSMSTFSRIKAKDIVVLSRTLSVMISASVPLVDALRNISSQTVNPALREVLSDITSEVEAGTRLSDALEKHPKVFTGFFVNMIRSGETSGQLQGVLEYLADQQEKDYDLTSRIRGAFIYPGFILGALFVVGFLMMTFVVPSLTGILEEAGTALPMSTKMLIAVSGFFQAYWILILLFIGLSIVAIRILARTPVGHYWIDNVKLRIPVFGKLFQSIYVVRFSRSFSTLIQGGVDQVTALEIVSNIVGNQVWRQLIFQTIREVNEGNSMTTAFLRDPSVPSMMNQMISVGEETGKLQETLQRVADFYKREVDNLVANLVTLIEPVVMILLGLAVGVMVSAILLPLYNMSSAL